MNKDTQVNRLQQMIAFLMEEKGEVVPDFSEKSEKDLEEIWRGLVNIRPAIQADIRYLELEEAYLKQYHTGAIVGLESCQGTNEKRIKLYHGDLCHLEVDAIVNAANSDLLGCFIPYVCRGQFKRMLSSNPTGAREKRTGGNCEGDTKFSFTV